MVDISVSNCDGIAARAEAARARFTATGTNVSQWARDRGFQVKAVHAVLSGTRRCRWGQSHQIAVALGIKDEPVAEAAE